MLDTILEVDVGAVSLVGGEVLTTGWGESGVEGALDLLSIGREGTSG